MLCLSQISGSKQPVVRELRPAITTHLGGVFTTRDSWRDA
jgi:hypothetical protein